MILGYFDTETYHRFDFEHDGIDIRITGNQIHIFDEGMDTFEIPTVWVKCASFIVFDDAKQKDLFIRTYDSRKEDVMDELLRDIRSSGCDYVFAHNLKYDASYINCDLGEDGRVLSDGWTCIRHTVLMGENEALYNEKLRFIGPRDRETGKCETLDIELRDSAKLWHNDLRTLGDKFGVTKGDEAISCGVSDAMLEYCLTDSRIIQVVISKTLDIIESIIGERKLFMTAASMAYHLAMHSLEDDVIGKLAKKGYCPDHEEARKAIYEYVLNGNPDLHPACLREMYRGSSPLLDPSIRLEALEHVIVYDVNSMYPYQMMHAPIPIGVPMQIDPRNFEACGCKVSPGSTWCASVMLQAYVKKGHRATYLDKKESLLDDIVMETIHITEPDWELLNRDYDLEYVEFKQVWVYQTKIGLFSKHIDRWYKTKSEAKKQGNQPLAEFSKLMLNSLYGKFGMRSEVVGMDYIIEDGIQKTRKAIPKSGKPRRNRIDYYLPIAVWCTAYARNMISKVCNSIGWEHVAYTDTDSVHIYGLTEEETIERIADAGYGVSPTKLGDFKREEADKDIIAVYIRNKGYVHADFDSHKVYDVKMAGVTEVSGIRVIEDCYNREKMKGIKRLAYSCRGGKLLMDKEVELIKECVPYRLRVRRAGMTEDEALLHLLKDLDDVLNKKVKR